MAEQSLPHSAAASREQRKYSADEIDRMRSDIRSILNLGSGSYRESERGAAIEDQLRTYMVNGTEPEEISALLLKKQSEPRWQMISCTMT